MKARRRQDGEGMDAFHPSFEYEPSADALVVKLRAAEEIARTIEIDDRRFVDVNDSNEVVEIEVLWASSGTDFTDLIDRFGLWNFKPFLEEVAAASEGFRPRSFA